MGYEEFRDFQSWFAPALLHLLIVLGVCAVLGTVVSALISVVRYGPGEAFYKVWGGFFRAIPDMVVSPRRVGAIARLAIQETLRRRVMLVAFAMFALALLFGGWFLDPNSDHPERTYLGFVLAGTQFLVLFLGLLISTFSLPQDIQNKTIYTVVTKPIKASEIVLGRIVGFLAVGTVLLAAMGTISLLFVLTGLSHSHDVSFSKIVRVEPNSTDTDSGRRASDNAYYELLSERNNTQTGHRHRIEAQLTEIRRGESGPGLTGADFVLQVMPENGHTHELTLAGIPGDGKQVSVGGVDWTVYPDGGLVADLSVGTVDDIPALLSQSSIGTVLEESGGEPSLGEPVDMLMARVPRYASNLRFRDRAGAVKTEGVSVGKMSQKYSYIDGGTEARAMFGFSGLDGSDFPEDQVSIDLSLRVFRTFKGEDITRRVTGVVFFQVDKEVDGESLHFETRPIAFESMEYAIQTLTLDRQVEVRWADVEGNPQVAQMDLFDEFADPSTGGFEIVLVCSEPGQYFGVSPLSVYFKMRDGSFSWNFAKCYLGIWMQLVIVTSLGVALSTFLNASVSLLTTVGGLCVGFFGKFINELSSKELEGGGPIEAVYRLVTQLNVTSEIEGGGWMSAIDVVLLKGMSSTTNIIPDFTLFDTQAPLADGYDIPLVLLGVHLLVTFTFVIGAWLVGYFALRTREIAG
ncbi:MAG: hypothetical protein R3B96_19040 [Pirellulaceae bacterium]